ncbi:MAG: sigma-54 dependent transcriptional regulator [Pseudomonadota bacterium]
MDQKPEANRSVPQSVEAFRSDISQASVLVVDDEPGMRNFLAKSLATACGRVDVTSNTIEASDMLDRFRYDVVVLDNIMPQKNGVAWLAEQRQIGLFSDAILMTAYADLETAIAAIRAGACDFLLKPFRVDQLLKSIGQTLERSRLKRQNVLLNHELGVSSDGLRHRSAILGSSPEIETARAAIERAGRTNASCVIRGEVGSGKQVAARMLHAASDRADKPFFWLQSYGMTEEAMQERLFGKISAGDQDESNTDGILLNAAGGTLFLDEVEVLSLPCQSILVELLTTGRFRPLGATRSVPLDVRIVSSTTRSLQSVVQDGAFRADLYYLLNVVEIDLPPLRERRSDVLDLANYFITHLSGQMGIPAPELTAATRRRLLAHHWPGNVMELRNYIERALIHNDFETSLVLDGGSHPTESLAAAEQRHILSVLEACGGNRAEAARRLGVARKTIDRKCQTWGL